MAITGADMIVGFGLAMMLEGIAYALFPDGVKKLMVQAMAASSDQLRMIGFVFAAFGLLLISIAR